MAKVLRAPRTSVYPSAFQKMKNLLFFKDAGMKRMNLNGWIAACLLATAIVPAYAQTGGSAAAIASASAPMEGASSTSAKTMRAANRQLAKNVRHALARAKGLSIVNVTVRAKQGTVTLQGSMPDSNQIEQAGQIASGVTGVTGVKNDLTTIRQAQ